MSANNVSKASIIPVLFQNALALAYQSLDTFFDNPAQIEVAFGSNYNQTVANQLFTALSQGDFSALPEVKILSNEVLGATNGAYSASKNQIYLNERFLIANADNVKAIASVLIEEIGHFIDAQINTVDSAGDEGDIFTHLVQGKSLSKEALADLKAEDDGTTIVLNGEKIAIEQNVDYTNNLFNSITLPENFDLKSDNGVNLYIGDFNGDGKDDFLRQEKGSWDDDNANTANVFLSNGNGTFTKYNLPETFDLKSDNGVNLYIGDFNGDGKDDFLRQEKGGWDDDNANTANVFLSNGNGTFTKYNLPETFDLKSDNGVNLYRTHLASFSIMEKIKQRENGNVLK